MGLIQRQGLKFSIVNWFGIFIGALSTLYVFPYALEEYGLMRFVLDTSMLFFPLVSLGTASVIIRFFPYFEDKESVHHGFLGWILLCALAGFILFAGLCIAFQEPIMARYAQKSPLFQQYLWLIIPAMLLTTLNNVLYRYSLNFNRIVIPSLLLEVSQKIALPILIGAYLWKKISLTGVMYGLMAYLMLTVVGFVWYIISLNAWRLKPDIHFVTPEIRKQIRDFAIHGMITGLAMLLITRLDSWLVGTMLNLTKGGIYSISAFIANVIEVPSRAVMSMGVPLMAKYWKDKNVQEIENLYQKTSINMLIIGLLLFGAFWVSVEQFFNVLPNSTEIRTGQYVILFLGLARLVDMATGLNNHILIYSEHYRFTYLQLVVPAITSLVLGYYLTLEYGMIGTAVSNLVSVVLYNAISIMLNWRFFKLQPFSRQSLKVLGIALAVFGLIRIIPVPAQAYVAIIVQSGLYMALFMGLLYYFRLSPDLNQFMVRILKGKGLK